MKTENKTDKFFRENLRNHGVTPSASVWDTLEKALDQETKPKAGFAYKKAIFAVAILLTVSAGIWYASGDESNQSVVQTEVNDSLKNTNNQNESDIKKTAQNEAEKSPSSEALSIRSMAEIKHEDNIVTSSINSTKNTAESVQNNTTFSQVKSQQSILKSNDQKTGNQKNIINSSADSVSVTPEVENTISNTKPEKGIEEKAVEQMPKKQTHKVEIIIKMGNEAGNRQSPRSKEMSEMFPEADSIEKVQKRPASRLGRVMKQMKNFKNGEKVDLSQLKKNPDSEKSNKSN